MSSSTSPLLPLLAIVVLLTLLITTPTSTYAAKSMCNLEKGYAQHVNNIFGTFAPWHALADNTLNITESNTSALTHHLYTINNDDNTDEYNEACGGEYAVCSGDALKVQSTAFNVTRRNTQQLPAPNWNGGALYALDVHDAPRESEYIDDKSYNILTSGFNTRDKILLTQTDNTTTVFCTSFFLPIHTTNNDYFKQGYSALMVGLMSNNAYEYSQNVTLSQDEDIKNNNNNNNDNNKNLRSLYNTTKIQNPYEGSLDVLFQHNVETNTTTALIQYTWVPTNATREHYALFQQLVDITEFAQDFATYSAEPGREEEVETLVNAISAELVIIVAKQTMSVVLNDQMLVQLTHNVTMGSDVTTGEETPVLLFADVPYFLYVYNRGPEDDVLLPPPTDSDVDVEPVVVVNAINIVHHVPKHGKPDDVIIDPKVGLVLLAILFGVAVVCFLTIAGCAKRLNKKQDEQHLREQEQLLLNN